MNIILAEDMHLAEEAERMEQNLLRTEEEEEEEDGEDGEDEEGNGPFAKRNEEEYFLLIWGPDNLNPLYRDKRKWCTI